MIYFNHRERKRQGVYVYLLYGNHRKNSITKLIKTIKKYITFRKIVLYKVSLLLT